MQEEKIIAPPEITQNEQAVSKIETNNFPDCFSYHDILQGTLSNSLSQATEKKLSKMPVDELSNTIIWEKGGVKYTFKLSEKGKVGLPPIALEVLQLILINLGEKGLESPHIQISILQYLNLKGKLNTPENYKQAKKDLKEGATRLMITFFGYEDKRKGVNETQIGILDNKFMTTNSGFLDLFIKQEFFNLLKMEGKGILPDIYFLANKKENPYTGQIVRLLMNHKETNLGKQNEHILSIRTITKELGLMSEEEAKERRRVKELVKDVIERDLKPAEGKLTQLSWHYCRKNNTPLTKQEEKKLTTIYYSLNLWYNFPDTPEQAAKRNKAIEHRKKRDKKIENSLIKSEVNKKLGKVANK